MRHPQNIGMMIKITNDVPDYGELAVRHDGLVFEPGPHRCGNPIVSAGIFGRMQTEPVEDCTTRHPGKKHFGSASGEGQCAKCTVMPDGESHENQRQCNDLAKCSHKSLRVCPSSVEHAFADIWDCLAEPKLQLVDLQLP